MGLEQSLEKKKQEVSRNPQLKSGTGYSTSKKTAISLGIAVLFTAAIALTYPVIFLYFIGFVAIAVLIVVVGIAVRRIKEIVDDMMFG